MHEQKSDLEPDSKSHLAPGLEIHLKENTTVAKIKYRVRAKFKL